MMTWMIRLILVLCAIYLCEQVIWKVMDERALLGYSSTCERIEHRNTEELFFRTPMYPDGFELDCDGCGYCVVLGYESAYERGKNYPSRIIMIRSGKVFFANP